jgi:hypothetical protein
MQSAFFAIPSSVLFCRFLYALCVLGALCVIPFVSSARAQENYEIQVYAYDTVEPGHTTDHLIAKMILGYRFDF